MMLFDKENTFLKLCVCLCVYMCVCVCVYVCVCEQASEHVCMFVCGKAGSA